MTLVNTETGEVLSPSSGLFQYAHPTGLDLPDGIGFERWSEMGEVLRSMEGSIMWWLGDWWRYGERWYGEASSQAAPTGFAAETCRKAAWVSESFESVRRRTDLTFGHHQEVAALAAAEADALLDKAGSDGWSVRDLRQEVKRHRTAVEVGERYARQVDEPPPARFPVLVIDPPWRYDNKATRAAAEDHYSTLSIAQLCGDEPTPYDGEFIDFADTVRGLASDDCHLYLWVTNGFLREGFQLLDAWGFTYKACLTWVKPQMGIGNYFRNNTEHVLFAIKGTLPTLSNNVMTAFTADRTRHSAKPDSFYDIVERSSPGPYMEMFSRYRRLNWYVWGDQA